jgi:hypothetical protein
MRVVDQQNALCASEVRVEPEHLDRECYFVDDSLAGSVTTTEQFEIFDPVVLPVAVDVVDGFILENVAPQSLRHDVAMFHDGVFPACHEGRYRNPNVSISLYMSSVFSRFKSRQSALSNSFVFAFSRAVFLLAIKAAARFSTLGASFSTIVARKSVRQFGVLFSSFRRTRARTVQRASRMFLIVFDEVRLHHSKGLAAFLASKLNPFAARSWACSVEPKRAPTLQAAKSLVCARVAEKGLAAAFTRFLDRHGFSPVLGSTGTLATPFGIVK